MLAFISVLLLYFQDGVTPMKLDVDCPWTNHEDIMVTKFFAHKHSGYMYDGYEIKVTGDPRDINEDRFQLEVIGSKEGTNKFLYTKPAVPASLWLDEPANDDDASEEIQTGNQIFSTKSMLS